jgi:hypothetical protein
MYACNIVDMPVCLYQFMLKRSYANVHDAPVWAKHRIISHWGGGGVDGKIGPPPPNGAILRSDLNT